MKKHFRIIAVILCAAICLTGVVFAGCTPNTANGEYKKNDKLDTSKEVTLRIASNKDSWEPMEEVINKFEAIYENCTVICEYIEDYATNIPIRLNQTEDKIDIFRAENIQVNIDYKDNAYNLISDEAKEYLTLDGTNAGLVDNFKYIGAENTQYSIPYGGEMRGMYVNITLLHENGLEVPTNRAELLHCCEVLFENGYIPFQSSNGTFAQQLLYPYICNSIVNGGKYEETFAAIDNIEDGVSEYFRDAFTFLYDIVNKGYFDYKRVEEELSYSFSGSDDKAKEFLNIATISEDVFEKQDDVGKIAFLVDAQSFEKYLDENKADYNSEIEYKFIVSPVGIDGGYAYLSPADALAINKESDNIEWALTFLDFFFNPIINTEFAESEGKIPNTADALLKYDVPANRACDVGQVTFSYNFYKVITPLMLGGYEDMIGISKMNAEKYMKDDGTGKLVPMYTLEEYMARLEEEFQKIKASK